MLFFEIGYIIFAIIFAGINKEWIEDGKKIKHGINGLIHLAFAFAGWFIWAWPVFFIILLNTRVVFDICLNLFRELPIDYVSPKPASIIDKLEKWIFKNNGVLPKLIYIFSSIVLNFVYFKFYY